MIFNQHIRCICNKISKSISVIYKLKDLLAKHCLFLLFYFIVHDLLHFHLSPTYIRLLLTTSRTYRMLNHCFIHRTYTLFMTYRYILANHMYKNRNSQLYDRSHHHNTSQRHDLLSLIV